MRNCVDLSLLARAVDGARWTEPSKEIGLARLVAFYENRLLSKAHKTRMSDWASPLNEKQQECRSSSFVGRSLAETLLDAANDAHAGYTIHKRLSGMLQTMTSKPSSVCYTFSLLDGRLCEPPGAQQPPRTATPGLPLV